MVFLVIKEVRDVRVKPHDDVFAVLQIRLLLLDRPEHVIGNGHRRFDPSAPVAVWTRAEKLILQAFSRPLARHFYQPELGNL